MDIFGVVYMSCATEEISPEALDQLLLVARANNTMMGITGVLIYGDQQFVQYFEGDRSSVDHIYARIRASSLHTDIVELEYRQMPQRLLRKWFMGFRDIPTSLLQQLSQEQWSRERPWLEDQSAASPGLEQLLKFLNGTSAVTGSSSATTTSEGR